ncbi:MAG: discoidin domain-containing protein, partial [Bacteroidales bacterium]|nr:discoidin domain-containing protein [Bacteroidales bacterium]
IDENYKSKVLKTELINDTWKLEESFEKYDSKNNVHFSAQLLKIPAGRTIKLLTPYSSQYTGGGDNALIDLRQGGTNWKLGTFQGYWGENVEAVIDLGSEKEITKLGGNFAQDERAWIFMPTKVEYYVSSDGKNFTLLETVNNPIDERDETIQTHTFFTSKKAKTRYIKMKAYNRMTNPDWHLSPGEKSWLFIDEIIIR